MSRIDKRGKSNKKSGSRTTSIVDKLFKQFDSIFSSTQDEITEATEKLNNVKADLDNIQNNFNWHNSSSVQCSINGNSSGTCMINGRKYSGSNISVAGNKVYIDGKLVDDAISQSDKEINIVINGNVNNIATTSGDVEVFGNVQNNIQTTSGDVACKDVHGNITTVSGDVECDDVNGNVNTVSGDIK